MTLRGFKYHADFPTRIVGCRMLVLLVVLLAVASAEPPHYERCTIMKMLEEKSGINMDLVKKIVYFADQRNGFNKAAVEFVDDKSGHKRYGTFQLIDQLVCRGGVSETQNICHVECSNFLDNDLSDDIDCLKKLREYTIDHYNTTNQTLKFLLNRSFTFWSVTNVPDDYFERCYH